METKIAGTYKLIEYGYQSKTDQSFRPISDWYAGEIHYCNSGRMSVLVRFAEKPEEFSDVVGYSGTYQVQGRQIDHLVTMSVRPEYVGQTLSRDFHLENDILYTEFENTKEFIKFARWARV
jgi:hypothetical protein